MVILALLREKGGGEINGDIERNQKIRPGLTKKGCALNAAIYTGVCNVQRDGEEYFSQEKFESFWSRYLAELLYQCENDADYLIEILNKEREERRRDTRENRRQKLIFAIFFSLSFFIGMFFGYRGVF